MVSFLGSFFLFYLERRKLSLLSDVLCIDSDIEVTVRILRIDAEFEGPGIDSKLVSDLRPETDVPINVKLSGLSVENSDLVQYSGDPVLIADDTSFDRDVNFVGV